jgi:hypothetical protein
MAPSFETMYHGPHFLFMCWPLSFHMFNFLLSNAIGLPSCIKTPLIAKLEAIKVDLKIFVEIKQLQHWRFRQITFQRFKGLIACFTPFINFE